MLIWTNEAPASPREKEREDKQRANYACMYSTRAERTRTQTRAQGQKIKYGGGAELNVCSDPRREQMQARYFRPHHYKSPARPGNLSRARCSRSHLHGHKLNLCAQNQPCRV